VEAAATREAAPLFVEAAATREAAPLQSVLINNFPIISVHQFTSENNSFA
jgi:hypothetical protein